MLALQYAKKLFARHLPIASVHITSIHIAIIHIVSIHIAIIRITSINGVVTVMVSRMDIANGGL